MDVRGTAADRAYLSPEGLCLFDNRAVWKPAIPTIGYDAFVPGAAQRQEWNNWQHFMKDTDTASAGGGGGANLFFTEEARNALARAAEVLSRRTVRQ